MTISGNTIQAEGLGDFFKSLAKKGRNTSKRWQKNVLKNPGRASKGGANLGTAFSSRSPKAALSNLPEVIKFYHTDKGLYHGEFVWFLPDKANKKQTVFTHLLH